MSLRDTLRGMFVAASLLAEQGREVSNHRGGMRAWVAGGLPLVARGGRQGAAI
jgi:rhodanese-related sulfurtransferase